MEKSVRKQNRLPHYDYSAAGAYFITICTKNRENLFWSSVGANCVRPQENLTKIGLAVEKELVKWNELYNGVCLDKYVIMPNHIHAIVIVDGRTQFAPTISRIVKQFKGTVSKTIGFSPWQRSFYDHVIRGEKDYLDVWSYIDNNPKRWLDDPLYSQ